jgi:hypothetical protein
MKTADKVFADGQIDPSFATDRRIDLRQQASGNLNKRQASHVHSCRKAGYVADEPPTQRHHTITSFKPALRKEIEYLVNCFDRLVTLTIAY